MSTAFVITLRIAFERAGRAVLDASERPWSLLAAVGQWLSFLAGGIGIDFEAFTGPLASVVHFGQCLLPLAVLVPYFRTRHAGSAHARVAIATGLGAVTMLTGINIPDCDRLLVRALERWRSA
jgi:hypothetical protein